MTLYHATAKMNNVQTDVQYAADLPKTLVDMGKIEQVILNLIENAIAAMEETEEKVLRITIGREAVIGKNDFLRVTIADTGTGIRKQDMTKLFEPFLPPRLPVKEPAWGFPYHSASFRITAAESGRRTTSGEGHPSFSKSRSPGTRTGPYKRKEMAWEKFWWSMMKPKSYRLLQDFLTSKGYEVATALNGAEALAKVREMKPDIVLLDIIMPGMGGIDTLKEIKKIDPSIAVIMVTAVVDEELANRAVKLGAFDYITKPINIEYLETCVMIKMIYVLDERAGYPQKP